MALSLTRRRFAAGDYHRMLETGILYDGERVELLAGEVWDAAAMGSRHAACVRRLQRLFGARLGERVLVSVQSPIALSDDSEPEPDLALLAWRRDDYAAAHPRPEHVLLAIEVADSSYGSDSGIKLPHYAAAGIGELWIVRLDRDEIEAHLDAAGGRYARVERHRRGETIVPRLFPEVELAVDELLP